MDAQTVAYCDANADRLAARYERASMAVLHHLLLRHLPSRCRVLEIGGGSGRDAAFLLGEGYDVEVIDASQAMPDAACVAHPELHGRVRCAAFPLDDDGTWQPSRPYDAIVSNAMLMHLPDHVLFDAVRQMRELLVERGVVLMGISHGRGGLADNQRCA